MPGTEHSERREPARVAPAEDLISSDLLGRFCREAARFDVLERTEEDRLAARIAARRAAILALLTDHPGLIERALAGQRKGIVHPSRSFREREVLRVLAFARREAAGPRHAPDMQRLAARLQRHLIAYRSLRDQMLAANLRLVITFSRRYRHPSLSQLDLIQEGILGLVRAIERYQPNRGLKFSTYAVWWIWQHLTRAGDTSGATIRTPVHWNQFRRKLRRTARDCGFSEDELAQAAAEHGVSVDYARAMGQGVSCFSLHQPTGDDEASALESVATADATCDPAAVNESRELKNLLRNALRTLPPRECDILCLRFGLANDHSLTLEEIGRRYGVSRERIRQIEARAIQQMRQICSRAGLADFLN